MRPSSLAGSEVELRPAPDPFRARKPHSACFSCLSLLLAPATDPRAAVRAFGRAAGMPLHSTGGAAATAIKGVGREYRSLPASSASQEGPRVSRRASELGSRREVDDTLGRDRAGEIQRALPVGWGGPPVTALAIGEAGFVPGQYRILLLERRVQGGTQVLQVPLLVQVVRRLARPDIDPHAVSGPVSEDVQAVPLVHVHDAHRPGVTGPGVDAPSLGGLAEAIPLVDVVAVPRIGAPVEVQALAGGHALDVVVAAGRHEGEPLISTVVGVVGDDVRPVGALVLVDVE